MAEILTIGEPLVLFASQDEGLPLSDALNFHKYLAGAEVNVAVGATRLGHAVSYLTAVGEDPLGKFVLESLQESGISTENVQRDASHWTGVEFKSKTSVGDPETFYMRKGSAASQLQADELLSIDLTDTKLAHITGIFPAISTTALAATRQLITKLHAANVTISFDPNLRPALWEDKAVMVKVLNELAAEATIVMPGISEARTLTGKDDPAAVASFYFEQSEYTRVVIIKMGTTGAYYETREGKHGNVPGFVVKQVVDTVGAGDGFALGVVTALLEQLPLDKAVQRGNAIGAFAVQAPGDNDGYPTQERLAAFLDAEARH